MDPRTVSRRDMREQINKYMTTVLQEEPVTRRWSISTIQWLGKKDRRVFMKIFLADATLVQRMQNV